jgi:hypothetical protein
MRTVERFQRIEGKSKPAVSVAPVANAEENLLFAVE